MALYAIGDFHLSFTVHKPMDVFGKEWKDHVRKLRRNWLRTVRDTDTPSLRAIIPGAGIWRNA